MTWLKLSDDFADDLARIGLSDAAFRAHVEGLLWSMRRETGGELDRIAVRRCIEVADPDAAIQELVDAGLWARLPGGGFQVVHGMDVQVEPDVMAKRREANAERQRRKRRKAVGIPDPDEPLSRRDDLRDDQRDNTRDAGLVWSGLDGNVNTSSYEGTGAAPPTKSGTDGPAPGWVAQALASRARAAS